MKSCCLAWKESSSERMDLELMSSESSNSATGRAEPVQELVTTINTLLSLYIPANDSDVL